MSQSLSDRLVADMKAAMRDGDTERRDVIRFLRSAIGNKEIEERRPLTDDDIVGVIQTQIKQRMDAAEMFTQGNREDLATREKRQADILREYLPEQLSEEEIEAIAREAAERLGLAGPGDMGKLMPEIMKQVRGRADGRTVSRIARDELARRASGDEDSSD